MNRTILTLLAGLLFSCLVSCVPDSYADKSPTANFEALWRLMDENYCFFELKADELGLDWDEVYDRYRPMISDSMDDNALFEVLCRMLGELKDGHVNIITTADIGRNWSWREDYPVNFYSHVQDNYLGTDYKIGGGLRYQILDDNIGYVYYGDFSSSASDVYWEKVFNRFALCNGIIIDVRNNGGGLLPNVLTIISHFTDERVLCGYVCHKNGKGHDDFSSWEEQWVEPSSSEYRWQKPVAVLTNRGCFSATNSFVAFIKELPDVRVFGDRTGGGGGIPLSTELPNGWSVRYSSAPMTDAAGNHIESGVEPDVRVDISEEDMIRGVDTIIESAREWLNSLMKL